MFKETFLLLLKHENLSQYNHLFNDLTIDESYIDKLDISASIKNKFKAIASCKGIREGQLTTEAIVWLKYKPLTKIPHDIITDVSKTLKFKHIVCGSYRRKSQYSSDIDILTLVSLTTVKKHITSAIIYMEGDEKLSCIIPWLINNKKQYLKIDIMHCTKESYPAFLLYLTGSKYHNIRMRAKAKSMGYLLNQHGLYHGMKLIDVKNEEDIFDILGMLYKKPEERR